MTKRKVAHLGALFALFGLILVAVLGLSINCVSFKELVRSWQELIGAVITAAVTAFAVIITNKHTRAVVQDQLLDQKLEAIRARRDEVRRILVSVHYALDGDKLLFDIIDSIAQDALIPAQITRENRHDFVKATANWRYSSRNLILRATADLGDIEARVCKILITYDTGALLLLDAVKDTEGFDLGALSDAKVREVISFFLKTLRAQRVRGVDAQIVIERYLDENGLESVPKFRDVNFTEAEIKRRELAIAPVKPASEVLKERRID